MVRLLVDPELLLLKLTAFDFTPLLLCTGTGAATGGAEAFLAALIGITVPERLHPKISSSSSLSPSRAVFGMSWLVATAAAG